MTSNSYEIIADALLTSPIVKEDGEFENQLEVANRVRTDLYMDTAKTFSDSVPYETIIDIYNNNTYIWNDVFIDKLLGVLKNGFYGNDLALNEKELIKSYIDFKYNGFESNNLLISLDNHIGAL